MRRVRVLINAIHANTGGGLTYLRNLLPLLAADSDLELHLLLRRGQEKLLKPTDPRIAVHFCNPRGGLAGLLVWEQVALPFLARRIGADVTFSPANYGPLAAPRPVILLSNALAVGGHETRILKRLYWHSLSLMTRLSLLTARQAIAVSAYARDALSFGARDGSRRVAVVHHGVNRSFAPASGAVRGSFLLAVGDLYIQKNFHGLLRSFAALCERFPDVTLRIAGADVDADYSAGLRRIVTERRLDRRVEFLGIVDNGRLRELYQTCRLFVFPSTVETFGMPLIEAMACGAPVACSRQTAMPEIAGEAAAYFEPSDEADMTRVLAELLGNEERRNELSRRGLQRARDFSWDAAAARTAAVLKAAADHG